MHFWKFFKRSSSKGWKQTNLLRCKNKTTPWVAIAILKVEKLFYNGEENCNPKKPEFKNEGLQ